MHALLAVVLVTASVETYPSHEKAAAALASRMRTGTLLFSEGDCLAVKVFTGSPYTHVAGVFVENETVWVYDSQNGVGVRKLPLAEYLAATRPDEIHVLQPTGAFDEQRAASFRKHLEAQLGRPYAVKHHLTGSRCDGLHCAEYMTDSLMAADLIEANSPPRVSPASLRSGLLKHKLYAEEETVCVLVPEPERAPEQNWCHELWLDTKDCCASCWGGFRRCVLCR
jgi:hypothetical protein